MIEAIGPFNSGLTAGGAGVATANADSGIEVTGKLMGFYVRYNGSPPATTDVTIKTVANVLPQRTLFVLTDANTDGYFPIQINAYSPAGSAITGIYNSIPLIREEVNILVAQADNSDSVDVWAIVENQK